MVATSHGIDYPLILVTIHIVSAILLLGPTTAFSILGKRSASPSTGGWQMLDAMLDIEHKLVLPGSVIQLVTGVLLITELDLDKDLFANGWLWTSILAFVTILVLSLAVDLPAVKRIVTAGKANQAPDMKDVKTVKGLGPVFGILFLYIVLMMILKPF